MSTRRRPGSSSKRASGGTAICCPRTCPARGAVAASPASDPEEADELFTRAETAAPGGQLLWSFFRTALGYDIAAYRHGDHWPWQTHSRCRCRDRPGRARITQARHRQMTPSLGSWRNSPSHPPVPGANPADRDACGSRMHRPRPPRCSPPPPRCSQEQLLTGLAAYGGSDAGALRAGRAQQALDPRTFRWNWQGPLCDARPTPLARTLTSTVTQRWLELRNSRTPPATDAKTGAVPPVKRWLSRRRHGRRPATPAARCVPPTAARRHGHRSRSHIATRDPGRGGTGRGTGDIELALELAAKIDRPVERRLATAFRSDTA